MGSASQRSIKTCCTPSWNFPFSEKKRKHCEIKFSISTQTAYIHSYMTTCHGFILHSLNNLDNLAGSRFTHHVLQVNEGVIDGHNLDALLKASPQDQAANATKSAETEMERLEIVAMGKQWETSSGCHSTHGISPCPLQQHFTVLIQGTFTTLLYVHIMLFQLLKNRQHVSLITSTSVNVRCDIGEMLRWMKLFLNKKRSSVFYS